VGVMIRALLRIYVISGKGVAPSHAKFYIAANSNSLKSRVSVEASSL